MLIIHKREVKILLSVRLSLCRELWWHAYRMLNRGWMGGSLKLQMETKGCSVLLCFWKSFTASNPYLELESKGTWA